MIYLVRHGETEFNLAGRYQGALDSPLTALGERQALAVGDLLKALLRGEAFEIVASPQGRAWRTAELIRERAAIAAPLRADPRLREISLGSRDGMRRGDDVFRHADGSGVSRWDWYFGAPDGEGYQPLVDRLVDWLEEARDPTRRIVAVSHGISGRVIRMLYGGFPKESVLTLEVPQDAVFRLAEGQVDRIDCAPL